MEVSKVHRKTEDAAGTLESVASVLELMDTAATQAMAAVTVHLGIRDILILPDLHCLRLYARTAMTTAAPPPSEADMSDGLVQEKGGAVLSMDDQRPYKRQDFTT